MDQAHGLPTIRVQNVTLTAMRDVLAEGETGTINGDDQTSFLLHEDDNQMYTHE